MAEETQYTAKTGLVTISTANPNLDGTGTITTVIRSGSNGALIKAVTVKAIQNTTAGVVRLFINNTSSKVLLKEILVPAITKAASRPTFQTTLVLNFELKAGYELMAATENAESFNIIAETLEWVYYAPSVRTDTTMYHTKLGYGLPNTANSNLDGTGTLTSVYSAGSSLTYKGSSLTSIIIKADDTLTTPGMVRLFIYNGTTKFLYTEVVVLGVKPSGSDLSFTHEIDFENNFELQADYQIFASTENAEEFDITVTGNDWDYVP
ncbi:MAG: hypothetical protein JNJ41_16360 [Bacteroidia bacterium]|nr:hypothetical protein [Bacteroidia bacterium]